MVADVSFLELAHDAIVNHPEGDQDEAAILAETFYEVGMVHVPIRHGIQQYCHLCRSIWPCAPIRTAESAALEWLVMASNVVMARTRRGVS